MSSRYIWLTSFIIILRQGNLRRNLICLKIIHAYWKLLMQNSVTRFIVFEKNKFVGGSSTHTKPYQMMRRLSFENSILVLLRISKSEIKIFLWNYKWKFSEKSSFGIIYDNKISLLSSINLAQLVADLKKFLWIWQEFMRHFSDVLACWHIYRSFPRLIIHFGSNTFLLFLSVLPSCCCIQKYECAANFV